MIRHKEDLENLWIINMVPCKVSILSQNIIILVINCCVQQTTKTSMVKTSKISRCNFMDQEFGQSTVGMLFISPGFSSLVLSRGGSYGCRQLRWLDCVTKLRASVLSDIWDTRCFSSCFLLRQECSRKFLYSYYGAWAGICGTVRGWLDICLNIQAPPYV